MPHQNRVTPFGDIVAVTTRGTLMGNRGCIHDNQRNLKSKRWDRKCWVICLLNFKDRKREIMSPGQYTELFFLDEATAIAAGHRPCGTCQREKYNLFKDLWFEVNIDLHNDVSKTITNLDNILHSERLDDRKKRIWTSRLSQLPNGAMVTLDNKEDAYLIKDNSLLKWTFDGYIPTTKYEMNTSVGVLTPESVVNVILEGYEVDMHEVLDIDL